MSEKDWSELLTSQVGRAVQNARKQRGISVQKLADLCAQIGLPFHRDTLANLESGKRSTVTVPELIVIAEALDVAPIALVFPPRRPLETMEYTPGRTMPIFQGYRKFAALGLESFGSTDSSKRPEERIYALLDMLFETDTESLNGAAELYRKTRSGGALSQDDDDIAYLTLSVRSWVTANWHARRELSTLGVFIDPPDPVLESLYYEYVTKASTEKLDQAPS